MYLFGILCYFVNLFFIFRVRDFFSYLNRIFKYLAVSGIKLEWDIIIINVSALTNGSSECKPRGPEARGVMLQQWPW